MYLCIIKISSIFDVPVFPLVDGIAFHVLHTLSSGTLSKNEICYGLSYETKLRYDDGSGTYSEALSWVAPTCDPSGSTKVMERGYGLFGWSVSCNMLACPLQVESCGELREAGFTEQRIPLAPNSGGTTGCCTSSPLSPVSLAFEPSLFSGQFLLVKERKTLTATRLLSL
ncbi:hypothetical protein MTR_1g042410 [Medicago truncatula]|uniref:Uncharacterized protein n=1 Tax=Medicago truncatula TaxID=3880 RepID=G7I3T0_MEDTR|nr:hypothetical protein MTR_1g042410 [Medicago truncatula]